MSSAAYWNLLCGTQSVTNAYGQSIAFGQSSRTPEGRYGEFTATAPGPGDTLMGTATLTNPSFGSLTNNQWFNYNGMAGGYNSLNTNPYWRFLPTSGTILYPPTSTYLPDSYGTPPDTQGAGAIGLDVSGRPIYSGGCTYTLNGSTVTVPGLGGSVLSTPYDIDLNAGPVRVNQSTGKTPYNIDNPFKPAEFEAVVRSKDQDAPLLPSRLTDLTSVPGTPSTLLSHASEITTEQWDPPVPAVAPTPDMIGTMPATMNNSVTHFVDLLRAKQVPSSQWAYLVTPDLLSGLRMDLNRPFGNGQPMQSYSGKTITNINPAVDAPETSTTLPQNLIPWNRAGSGFAPNTPSNPGLSWVPCDTNNSGIPPSTALPGVDPRQAYARSLYVLGCLLVDRVALVNSMPTGMSETPPLLAARLLAQWAANVAAFRDRSAAMCRFDYDPNFFLSLYNADTNATPTPVIAGTTATTMSPSTPYPWTVSFGNAVYSSSAPAGNTYTWAVSYKYTPSGSSTSQTTYFTVFGTKRPELLLMETFAFHDRRTLKYPLQNGGAPYLPPVPWGIVPELGQNTRNPSDTTDDSVSGTSTVPNTNAYDQTGANPSVTAGGVDWDFDQACRPEGSLFVKLYNPWTALDAPAGELGYGGYLPSGAAGWTGGVNLCALSGYSGNAAQAFPVWRLAITNGYAADHVTPASDPDDPVAPAAVWRSVYFVDLTLNNMATALANTDVNPVTGVKTRGFNVGDLYFPDTTVLNQPAAPACMHGCFAPILPGRYAVIGPGQSAGAASVAVAQWTQLGLETNMTSYLSGINRLIRYISLFPHSDPNNNNGTSNWTLNAQVQVANGAASSTSAPSDDLLQPLLANPNGSGATPAGIQPPVAMVINRGWPAMNGNLQIGALGPSSTPSPAQKVSCRLSVSEPPLAYYYAPFDPTNAFYRYAPESAPPYGVFDHPLDRFQWTYGPNALSSGQAVYASLSNAVITTSTLNPSTVTLAKTSTVNTATIVSTLPDQWPNGTPGMDGANNSAWSMAHNWHNCLAYTGTCPGYCMVHLQRLANPLEPFDPNPADGAAYNPYRTVDSMPVDLTVFNGAYFGSAWQFDTAQGENKYANNPPASSPMFQPVLGNGLNGGFSTVRRGQTDLIAGQSPLLWKQEPWVRTTAPQFNLAGTAPAPTTATGKLIFPCPFSHSLGYANHTFAPVAITTGTNTLTSFLARTSPAAYVGDMLAQTVSGSNQGPLSWLPWNNRPYISQLELLLVPWASSSRLLNPSYFGLPLMTGATPNSYSYAPSGILPFSAGPNTQTSPTNGVPFPVLMNFFCSGTQPGLNQGLQLHRLLEYVRVPSRFVGTDIQVRPDFASGSNGGTHQFHPPYNRISRYRDPGKINLNTITSQTVWAGLMNRYPDPTGVNDWGETPMWSKFVLSRRQGSGARSWTADLTSPDDSNLWQMLQIQPSYPTRFENPFRSYRGAYLTPVANMATNIGPEVNATLLRQDPQVAGRPLFATDSQSYASSSALGHPMDPRPNPFFYYQGLQRLGNLVTNRSNVYAVWITVGYFEVVPWDPNYMWSNPSSPTPTISTSYVAGKSWGGPGTPLPTAPVVDAGHPDGYQLGKEIGSDSGEVVRHRAFYIFDRTIPVGFVRGQNVNSEKAMLVKRFIE